MLKLYNFFYNSFIAFINLDFIKDIFAPTFLLAFIITIIYSIIGIKKND